MRASPGLRIAGIVLCAVVLAASSAVQTRASKGHDKSKSAKEDGENMWSRTTTIDKDASVGSGKRLELVLKTGASVRIVGAGKSGVSVTGKHPESDCPDAQLDAWNDDAGVKVHTYYTHDAEVHSCSMAIEIRVPERYDVHIDSAGGDVTIENLRGTVDGHTGGGDVVLSGVHGDVDLHTGGGDIHLSDSVLDGEIHSGGGSVLTSHVSGDVQVSAGGKRYR